MTEFLCLKGVEVKDQSLWEQKQKTDSQGNMERSLWYLLLQLNPKVSEAWCGRSVSLFVLNFKNGVSVWVPFLLAAILGPRPLPFSAHAFQECGRNMENHCGRRVLGAWPGSSIHSFTHHSEHSHVPYPTAGKTRKYSLDLGLERENRFWPTYNSLCHNVPWKRL